jgi:GNAT superfamily N-acetyltransferase
VTNYVSAPLAEHHLLDSFSCGVATLDAWLSRQARRADRAGTARTYVWTRPDDPRALAYFSLAPTQVAREQLPNRSLAAGYSVVPGYLLARLALDATLHGRHLGTQLLLDALERIVTAAHASGGRLIVTDAINDAAHVFYRHHDFIPLPGTNRLYLKISTAETALRT